jgi:hypothetical protein
LVNVTCQQPGGAPATVAQPCATYQYSNRSAGGFQAPNEGVNLNGSLWAIRFGARIVF